MTVNEKFTLLAIVLGPVFAVSITLWIEARRRTKENRLRIVRMLLSTRQMPAHQDYCAAINLVPLEFNNHKRVMSAWSRYNDRVREDPGLVGHDDRIKAAQSTLIYETMVATGLKLSEGDIQTQAYISDGFIKRDEIYIKFLQAMPEIAQAMKIQVEHTRQMLAGLEAARNAQQARTTTPARETL